jgi:hypothetical protein
MNQVYDADRLSHVKPVPVVLTLGDTKIKVYVVNQQPPTGLARAAYTGPDGWDVSVTITNKQGRKTFARVGSLSWTKSGGCGWSLGSEDGLWVWANTLSKECGGPWSYKTDAFALRHMAQFIKASLHVGPHKLTREMA